VLDSESTFYVYPRRDWFDSFREVSGGTMTLADGSTLSVVGVGAVCTWCTEESCVTQ
jgi:hypothetical protein